MKEHMNLPPTQPALASMETTSASESSGTIGGDSKLRLSKGYRLRFDRLSYILGAIAGSAKNRHIEQKQFEVRDDY
jgi:hypothetical protein